MPRDILIRVLTILHHEVGGDPSKWLADQIVPFATRFTCPVVIPRGEGELPYSLLFFIDRDNAQKKLTVFAAKRFDDEE